MEYVFLVLSAAFLVMFPFLYGFAVYWGIYGWFIVYDQYNDGLPGDLKYSLLYALITLNTIAWVF